ncbi:MAG TPA: hypothetical protein IAA57_00730 [Candidatus Pullilachnospira intestinigallinarum]|nr:hypothetical protein [Candidatus Pullilachnospira intestinigallinarum]
MKKYSMALLLTLSLVLTGCGGIAKAEETTVTVDDDGRITQALVENFSLDTYSSQELEEQIKGLIDAYNEENQGQKVSMESCQVKNEKARVLLEYASAADYRAFNLVDFFTGTVEEAQQEGYSFDCAFLDAAGKTVDDGTVPDGCAEMQVVIVKEPVCVLAPGEIRYVSSNMELLDKNRARLVSDTGLTDENAQVVTDAYGIVIYEK